jgi:Lysyl oxidase
MDAGATGRLGLTALVAALAVGAAAGLLVLADAAESGAPGDDLKPDLFVQRPSELYLADAGKEIRLRVSNTVANRGTGPLEMTGNGDDCPYEGPTAGKLTVQHLYEDSDDPGSPGWFERDADPSYTELEAGCSRYHPKHDHWHFDNFARYTLLDEPTGEVVGGSRKVSFCVIDTGQPYPDLPGSPEESYYPQDPGSAFPTCSETSVDGLSIGWEDTYGASLPGQGIRVTGLRRGYYCLVLETDPPLPGAPGGVLNESREGNNTRTIRLRMRPGRLFVARLGSDCKSL